jgi:UDPglucose 6-dehydrogenase
LEELVKRETKSGNLSFSNDLASVVRTGVDVLFLAVGTPPSQNHHGADLSQVFSVAREIAPLLTRYTVIVNKSTVPVTTAQKVTEEILRLNPRAKFDVVSNPEFLRESSAVSDFMNPDRIVIGSPSPAAEKVMRRVYSYFAKKSVPLVFTTPVTSELVKYASNAFLATKITFVNEIARLCEVSGADVKAVAYAMGLDDRIGSKFLQAGPGIGGSCFPKDTKALAWTGRELNAPQQIVESVISVNDGIKEKLAARIVAACGGTVRGKTVALLGLAFKANTDDMRESPALTIVPYLEQQGARVTAYDPIARENAEKLMPGLVCEDSILKAADGASVLVILTEAATHARLDFKKLAKVMKSKIIVDFRNLYELKAMEKTGFSYVSLGRPEIIPKQERKKR